MEETTRAAQAATPPPGVEAPERTGSRIRILCRSQEELEQALADGVDPRIDILLVGDASFTIRDIAVRATDRVSVEAWGASFVMAEDQSEIAARESSRVFGKDVAKIASYDNAQIHVNGRTVVRAGGNSVVKARGADIVYATGEAVADVSGACTAVWMEHSSGSIGGNAQGAAYDQSRVDAESGLLEAYAFSTVISMPGSEVQSLPGSTTYDKGGKLKELGGAIHRDDTVEYTDLDWGPEDAS